MGEQFEADAAKRRQDVAALEAEPAARAVLDSEPELREALRTVDSATSRKVLMWLLGHSWAGGLMGDQTGNVGTLLRQYRRQLERAARPWAPRPATSNEHVYEFERKPGEVIRATLAEFRGKRSLHLRTWFRGRDGAMRATARGITIAPELLSELEAAVAALRAASEAGRPGGEYLSGSAEYPPVHQGDD